jgi:two-component system, chemotaxis family, CheB/CheR fusion protein
MDEPTAELPDLSALPDSAALAFETLLEYLKESRGFDFTGYKRTSLARRVGRRMSQVAVADYAEYMDYLQVNPEEFSTLFNTILINVTGFFRDADTWEYLRGEVVPAIVAERGPEAPIRIWSAGCASGEEAYSLAILFAETLGIDAFRRRVKIYATDVDDEALNLARHATYGPREMQSVTPDLQEKYFEAAGARQVFRKDLRRSVIFGRNDLVQDAPISRIDLLVCRNTLMYFTPETQAKILGRFHFALAKGALLFLGKAEMLLSHGRLFDPVDLKHRIFRKAADAEPLTAAGFLPPGVPLDRRTAIGGLDELWEMAFAASPVAQIAVTMQERVALINHQAEAMFGLTSRDLDRPLRDLEVSYRPVELRGYLEQARAERRTIRIKEVAWQRPGADPVWLDIQVNPLTTRENRLLGVAIIFHDVSAARRLLKELENAHQRLETAYEELQSTNEELETTNEELQSTVEELETTNEELQSTNEELETMNEELQSANDELQTINDALRERSTELDELNAFLESVLTSLQAAVIVVDRDMRVLAWNPGAQELWGLRRAEVEGQHLLNLDIGLPMAELRPDIRGALADAGFTNTQTLSAVNRRGRDIVVRVVCGSLRQSDGKSGGAILVIDAMPADS